MQSSNATSSNDNDVHAEQGKDYQDFLQTLINVLDGLPFLESIQDLRTLEGEIKAFKRNLEGIKSNEKARVHSLKERLQGESRCFGNRNETEHDITTLENLQLVCDKMQRLNMLRETELERIRAIHENLSSELKGSEQLNQDLVNPEIEKLQFELSSIQQDASYCEKDVEQTEKVLLLLQNENVHIHANLDEVQNIIIEKTNEWNNICNGPKLARENSDVIQKEIVVLQDELSRINERTANTEASILEVIPLIGEETNRLSYLTQAQEKSSVVVEEKEDALKKLQRQLDAAKLNRGKIVTSRLQLELDLKNVQDSEKSTRRAETLWKKQLEGLTQMLDRKRLAVDSDTGIISHLFCKIDECERTIGLQKACNESVMKEADKIKSSIAHKVQRLSHHTSCREDLNIRLEKALQSVDEVETELNAASIDNNKSDKLLSLLSAHMEILVRKAVALTENEDEAKEQIKMKHLIITDLKNTLHESSKRLLDISALYETLKNEKDIITAARVASSEKIAGSERDMTVANLQLESLLSDYNQKSCVLLKHQDSHENSRVLRATLQTEKANVSFLLREKKEELNRQQLQMKNLRASLMTLQREISMQQSRKRSLLSANRLLSKKLRETTSEICRSHQKASLQERYIKESDISTRQRKEDIRLLSLKRADLLQTIALKKRNMSDRAELGRHIQLLHSKLRQEQCDQETIQKQLEDPNNLTIREPCNEDPDDIELDSKIQRIEQMLDENRGRLLQGIMTRDDIIFQVESIECEITERMDESRPLIDKLNRYKVASREITRRIMALLGELSMYKMLSLNLETERESLLQSAESFDFVDNGVFLTTLEHTRPTDIQTKSIYFNLTNY